MIKRLAVLSLSTVIAAVAIGGCANLPATTTTPTTSSTTEVTTIATTPETEETQPTRPDETTLILKLEGNDEQVAAKLFTSDLGYSMYLEADSYVFSVTDSQIEQSLKADRFTPIEALDSNPDMYLEIGHLDNITREAALTEMQDKLTGRFPNLTQESSIGVGVHKLEALVLHGVNGSDGDSEAFTSAVFSDGDGGVYYYVIIYFLEASEGYASRFNQYLDTFRAE